MTLDLMSKLFLDSRKRGVAGARRKCTPKTLLIYARNLKLFTKFMQENCGVTAYEDLGRLKLIAFTDWMDEKVKSGAWSKATELQVLRSLRALGHWVDKDEDCRDEHYKGFQRWLPGIERTPRRLNIPELGDFRKFKNAFDTGNIWHFRDYVVTCLLMTNGIRIGEACNLRIDCTKLEEETMIVTGKTGPRLVPITSDMVSLLRAWLKRRTQCRFAAESPYVFVSRNRPQMDPDGFRKAFTRHRKKYNLAPITAHTFRHAFCTHYLRKSGDIEKLRNITGHSSYTMLMDYLHLAKVGGKEAKVELEKVNLLKDV